jgi:nucleolar protein 56
MLLHTTWFGTFVIDAGVEVDFIGASRNPDEIADDLYTIRRGDLLRRERELLERYDIDLVTEERVLRNITEGGLVAVADLDIPAGEMKGYDRELLREAISRRSAGQEEIGFSDDNIMSAVGALDDIDSSLNLVNERIRDWYARSWPGAADKLDGFDLIRIMAEDPSVENIDRKLREGGIDPGDAPKEIPEGIGTLARTSLAIAGSRSEMESFIESEMETLAPNLSHVVGPIIGARLIHSAGGLDRLSKLPSSTVQVLGAEKAFFRFLKDGGRPPKHGVLFQHPMVHSTRREFRGRVARSMASAAALASRLDRYGGYDAERLKERLEDRLNEIREQIPARDRPKGGKQPPFREGWWAKKGKKRRKGRRK